MSILNIGGVFFLFRLSTTPAITKQLPTTQPELLLWTVLNETLRKISLKSYRYIFQYRGMHSDTHNKTNTTESVCIWLCGNSFTIVEHASFQNVVMTIFFLPRFGVAAHITIHQHYPHFGKVYRNYNHQTRRYAPTIYFFTQFWICIYLTVWYEYDTTLCYDIMCIHQKVYIANHRIAYNTTILLYHVAMENFIYKITQLNIYCLQRVVLFAIKCVLVWFVFGVLGNML